MLGSTLHHEFIPSFSDDSPAEVRMAVKGY
jgi:hypothetical protein